MSQANTRSGIGLGFGAVALFLAATAFGQQNIGFYERSGAADLPDSRAEREAERLVSLSPEVIISLLRKETGLLLQVKKAIVRQAYNQGQMLNPDELTDDNVFSKIREDDNVRVLATREIEERGYIRAKPNRDELARTPLCPPLVSGSALTPKDLPESTRRTQEDSYWIRHDDDLDCYFYLHELPPQAAVSAESKTGAPQLPGWPASPRSAPQNPSSQPPVQQNPAYEDSRRQLQQAQMQQREDFEDLQGDGEEFSAMSPEDLPMLLSTSSGSSPSGIGEFGKKPFGNSVGGNQGGTAGGASGSSLSSLLQHGNLGSGSQFPSQASLSAKTEMPRQPYFGRPSEQPQLRHRTNPYADVPALYDLYAQYQRKTPRLARFGQDIFTNGTGNVDDLPMDMPAGADYVVGPGDGLSIQLTGAVSRQLKLMVDREGRVALPEVGGVEVAGKSLGDVQRIIQSNLRSQYRDIEADVSLGRIRTVRVYVVGDVERPGAYDLSSLSTPLNAVYTAGGPTSQGSLRLLRHYRGKQLLQEVDVYDLLLHGVGGMCRDSRLETPCKCRLSGPKLRSKEWCGVRQFTNSTERKI